jgi:hypothetical protein
MSPHTSIAPADATDTRFRDTTSPSQEPPCCELGARSASAVTAPGSLSSGITPSGLWPPRKRPCTCKRRATKSGRLTCNSGQLRYAEAQAKRRQRESPGTVDRFPSSRSNTCASGGPRFRDGPRTAHERGGSSGRGYPVASTPRLSRPEVGGPARSARWVLQLDPLPQACYETSLPTRRDIRFRPARPAASHTPRMPVPPSTHVDGAVLRPACQRLRVSDGTSGRSLPS